MFKSLKKIISRLSDPLGLREIDIFSEPQAKKKKARKQNQWEPIAISYECWGCKKKERISLKDKPSADNMSIFWRRWGTVEESQLTLYDGSCNDNHSSELFCPECRAILADHPEAKIGPPTAKPEMGHGYIASHALYILRKPSNRCQKK